MEPKGPIHGKRNEPRGRERESLPHHREGSPSTKYNETGKGRNIPLFPLMVTLLTFTSMSSKPAAAESLLTMLCNRRSVSLVERSSQRDRSVVQSPGKGGKD
jgi:hypothetical protein